MNTSQYKFEFVLKTKKFDDKFKRKMHNAKMDKPEFRKLTKCVPEIKLNSPNKMADKSDELMFKLFMEPLMGTFFYGTFDPDNLYLSEEFDCAF